MKIRYSLLLFVVLQSYFIRAQNCTEIERILDSTYASSAFYGNVLITKNSEVLFEKSFGYSDAVKKTPLTKNNSFQLASISKQFTAYGILILKSRGKLEYDSMVCKYIPTFPYKNITIRHLITHTSGLPNFWDKIRLNLDTTKSNGNKEVLDYLIKHPLPLQFEPGTKYEYADIGYDFLATIIENISGLSYKEFLFQNIFKPLKMKDTYAYMVTDISRIKNKNLAIGHSSEKGEYAYAHLQPRFNFVTYLGDFYGDGSMVSTAKDLAKWDKALRENTLLPATIQSEAFAIPIFNGQELFARTNPNIGYGFGWFIKDTPKGKLVYHSGGHPGNMHIIYRFLDTGVTCIFLSNTETAVIKALRSRILAELQRNE
ncbi:MAG: serine hydrolase [Bacteroidetes bacterium B1(2017)]|nr:MAG: serine hydrolase [Bacteroidetes bacterium B1(2017)]